MPEPCSFLQIPKLPRGRSQYYAAHRHVDPRPVGTRKLLIVVQSFSRVQLLVTPRTAARQASLSITNSRNSPKYMPIVLVMSSSHLILCHPFLLPPSIIPSITVFSSESVLHIKGPKVWNFSFSIHPSNEYLELISFRIDCFELLAVQGTLKSLLQFHSLK